ncbi:protein ANTAGONIST OF LIKE HETEROCHROMATIN PROTEIN 1-like [Curcuma longa]|uniref:protein ANTAGONIST OF LIKE HETEROCHROMATIN PROTEIN 1-like n=1 Tax=Curcuma longa TaxID=136217 RepID=UPI003D9DD434
MDPKEVAALVSFLVSQIPLLLLTLFPFAHPRPSFSTPFSPSAPQSSLLSLSLHLLSSASHIAAISPCRPRKRKRYQQDSEPHAAIALRRRDPDHSLLCFRMKSTTFEWLCGLLDPLLDCRDPAGSSLRLSGPTRLAIALSRLASGAPYPELAARFGVPESTARFCTKHLCRVLCTNFRFWITFPSASELASVSAGFQAAGGGLPDCCGALACTRFEAFGGSAIAAQIVADSSSRITHFVAGLRGDHTNFMVLKSSSLYKDVQEGKLLGATQYLVADGCYPLLPWLMVPFCDPAHGSSDENFNARHRSMRQPAIRVVQSMKNWGALSSLAEEENAKMAVACIGTCAILHNVLLMRDDFSTLSDIDDKWHTDLEHSGKDPGLEDFAIESRASTLRSMLALRARAA